MVKSKKAAINNTRPAGSNSKNIFIKMIEELSAPKYERIKHIHRIRPRIVKRSIRK